MEVKLSDIAKSCNVSKGLVSRILNKDDSLKCSKEVREKVLEEIDRQGYIPNFYAKMLSSLSIQNKNHKYKVGYISYASNNFRGHPYFDKIIEGIISEIKINNFELVDGLYFDNVFQKYSRFEPLFDEKIDGLIIFGEIEDKKFLKYLSEQAKYLISICDFISNDDIDVIGCDLSEAMKIMISCIEKYGYNEIGLIYGCEDFRKQSTMDIIQKSSLKINNEFFLAGKYDTQKAFDIISDKLKTCKPPKVICCLNDEMAIGCMRALIEKGYKVPEDVGVTGHDDILRANYCEVPLTTIRIFKEEIGRLAIAVLREKIYNKRKFGVKVFIPAKLIIRNSLIEYKKEKTNGTDL